MLLNRSEFMANSTHRKHFSKLIAFSGCELPRVVLGLKLASDGTRLTTFSSTKLCPVYLGIGNESKDRNQAFEHIAYLEEVRCIS
jgi:hypothetical protein